MPLVSGDQAKASETKLAGFRGAYGSVLFFEDPEPYEPLQHFKMYSDKFESWQDQTSGMHQLLVWTALEAEGLGANLQHYNPLIDDQVKKTWNLNPKWRLISQLVFGKPTGDKPSPKPKKPVEERYRVIS